MTETIETNWQKQYYKLLDEHRDLKTEIVKRTCETDFINKVLNTKISVLVHTINELLEFYEHNKIWTSSEIGNLPNKLFEKYEVEIDKAYMQNRIDTSR